MGFDINDFIHFTQVTTSLVSSLWDADGLLLNLIIFELYAPPLV